MPLFYLLHLIEYFSQQETQCASRRERNCVNDPSQLASLSVRVHRETKRKAGQATLSSQLVTLHYYYHHHQHHNHATGRQKIPGARNTLAFFTTRALYASYVVTHTQTQQTCQPEPRQRAHARAHVTSAQPNQS